MEDDTYVARTASLLALRYGDSAAGKARSIVAQLQSAGDHDGGKTWLRIILAIEAMQMPRSVTLN